MMLPRKSESVTPLMRGKLALGMQVEIRQIESRMKKPYLMISALVMGLAACQNSFGMNNTSAVKEEVFGK